MFSRLPIENTEIRIDQIDLPIHRAGDTRKEKIDDPDLKNIIDSFENPNHNNIDYKRWSARSYLMSQGVLFRYFPEMDEEEA